MTGHWLKCCKSRGRGRQGQGQSQPQSTFTRAPTTFTPSRGRGRGRRPPQQQHVRLVDDQHQQSDYEEESEDENYVFSVGATAGSKQPTTTVLIQGTRIKLIIDSGSSINIIDEKQWLSMRDRPLLRQAQSPIYAYGSKQPINIIGIFDSTVEVGSEITTATFYVTRGSNVSLMSYNTATDLNLLKINVNSISNDEPLITVEGLAKMHPQLFRGIGKLKDFQVTLHIDESVTPVAQPHRRIPFHMRKKVEQEIASLLQQDIIEKVEGPTPWVSPIVVAPKAANPNEIRICLDARQANRAITRTRYVTPTLDDIVHELTGSTVFSKLDLKSGYEQLELAENCRYISTFSTHIGLYRYKRLLFGLCSSSEVFQQTVSQVLSGLEGAINLSDDILVH